MFRSNLTTTFFRHNARNFASLSSRQLPTGVTSFVVDFTLNELDQFKILELGLLEYSATPGFDDLHPEETIEMREKKHMGAIIGQEALCINIGTAYSLETNFLTVSALDADRNIAVKKLINDHAFIKSETITNFLITLASYSSARTMPLLWNQIRGFNNEYFKAFVSWYHTAAPQSNLVLQVPYFEFYQTCVNKQSLHDYIKDSPIYPKTFSGNFLSLCPYSLNTFFNETESDYYVLKPTDSSCGKGVVVLSKNEVIPYLESIKESQCTEDYWKTHSKASFLLQVCSPSKTIIASDGRGYRPTGRLVFTITDQREPKFELLGAFWKFPKKPCDIPIAEFSRNTLVSMSSLDQYNPELQISADISDIDLSKILTQFHEHFLPIYKKIVNADCENYQHHYSEFSLKAAKISRELRAKSIVNFSTSLNFAYRQPITSIALLLAGAPYELMNAARIYRDYSFFPSNEMEFLIKNYGDGNINADFLLDVFKNSICNDYFSNRIEGLILGFSIEDVKSCWFSNHHIEAIHKNFTVEQVRGLSREALSKLISECDIREPINYSI